MMIEFNLDKGSLIKTSENSYGVIVYADEKRNIYKIAWSPNVQTPKMIDGNTLKHILNTYQWKYLSIGES